jgi:hypothetical protein
VTAEERVDFERNLQKFPPFLRELKPFMDRFDALSSAMAPVVSDLRASAPDLSRFLIALGPFSRASTVALQSLGDTADLSRPIIVNAEPTVKELARFTSQATGVARNARSLFSSIQKGGGIERLLDTLYYITLSTNGFDEIGHYLRNNLIVTICSGYAITPTVGCSANFQAASSSANSAATSNASPRAVASGLMDLLGLGDEPKSDRKPRDRGSTGRDSSGGSGGSAAPVSDAPAEQPAPAGAQPPEDQAGAEAQPGVGSAPGDSGDPLVDYLLGGAR